MTFRTIKIDTIIVDINSDYFTERGLKCHRLSNRIH